MWKKIIKFLGIIFVIYLISLSYFLSDIIVNLKKSDYQNASESSSVVKILLTPLSIITFNNNSSMKLVNEVLSLIEEIPDISNGLATSTDLNIEDSFIFDINKFKETLGLLNIRIQAINLYIGQSKIAEKLLNNHKIASKINILYFNQISVLLPDFISILDSLTISDQKIIVIFQNSDEIRATGGFMGSYAILDIVGGKITEITTEDIYDADGQFKGFIEAPSGVKEFLSDGKGLRLPNANWNPDFPSSAEQILQIFALGNKKDLNMLVAINPDFAKLILDISGNITLKDYNTIIDSNNITEVLRTRRSDFFPGSKQKKHLISQLITQMQINLNNLDANTKLNLVNLTLNQIDQHNLQLYSNHSAIDQILSNHNFRQELQFKNDADYLFLVESNVGINKANKNITREVEIELIDNAKLITIKFHNNNVIPTSSNLSELITNENFDKNNFETSNYLGYVNYQRIYIKPEENIVHLIYNNQEIKNWNENIIKNFKDESFKEVGFLITLKEKESSILKIETISPTSNLDKIFIQKQPGIPATPYQIKINKFNQQVLLEKNSLFDTM